MVISSRTGWSEKKILWDLPLARGWAYFHAAMLLDGVGMVFPGGSSQDREWWEQVQSRIAGR